MGKLISNAILAVMAAVVVGLLYAVGYFWMKSGEPMTVAESQTMAPGLTFRDFWASRVEQWRASDDEKEAVGMRRTCEPVATEIAVLRLSYTAFEVFRMREKGKQGDLEYSRRILAGVDDSAPSLEAIHEASYLDAVWATYEAGVWWQYAESTGLPGGPKLNHKRTCVTTYPTPADVSANRTQEAGALP
jgi:hypothetical protein